MQRNQVKWTGALWYGGERGWREGIRQMGHNIGTVLKESICQATLTALLFTVFLQLASLWLRPSLLIPSSSSSDDNNSSSDRPHNAWKSLDLRLRFSSRSKSSFWSSDRLSLKNCRNKSPRTSTSSDEELVVVVSWRLKTLYSSNGAVRRGGH